MSDIQTNRDLYIHIGRLVQTHRATAPPLQQYLRNLRVLALPSAHLPGMEASTFCELLAQAFEDLEPGDDAESPDPHPAGPFADWLRCIDRQIRDLEEMEADGSLNDEYRYFGIDAPSGARWYNFDPCTFIECGAAGSFGGWEDGDDTGRMMVPGSVAVLGPDGVLTTADPRDIEEPVIRLPILTWDDLLDFIEAGQPYE